MNEGFQMVMMALTFVAGMAGIMLVMARIRMAMGLPARRERGTVSGQDEVKLAALKSHEKLALDKLDVLKQAINMGWDDVQLKALDARLEQLVGKDNVARIAGGETMPSADLDSIALSPAQELERVRKVSSKQ